MIASRTRSSSCGAALTRFSREAFSIGSALAGSFVATTLPRFALTLSFGARLAGVAGAVSADTDLRALLRGFGVAASAGVLSAKALRTRGFTVGAAMESAGFAFEAARFGAGESASLVGVEVEEFVRVRLRAVFNARKLRQVWAAL